MAFDRWKEFVASLQPGQFAMVRLVDQCCLRNITMVVVHLCQHFFHDTVDRGVEAVWYWMIVLCCGLVALFMASKRLMVKTAYVMFLTLAGQDASNNSTSHSPSSSIFCPQKRGKLSHGVGWKQVHMEALDTRLIEKVSAVIPGASLTVVRQNHFWFVNFSLNILTAVVEVVGRRVQHWVCHKFKNVFGN